MKCPDCGTERTLLRDDDDNLYRRLCVCETTKPCFSCAKGKPVVALLDQVGEVRRYACAKHGNDDTRNWLALSEVPQKKETAKPKKVPQSAPAAPREKPIELPVYEGTCCQKRSLSTKERFYCSLCGKPVSTQRLEGGVVDGFYLTQGHDITSIIVMLKVHGRGDYVVRDFVFSIP